MLFRDVARPRIVEGRAPARERRTRSRFPSRSRAHDLAPGDELRVRGFTQEQVDALVNQPDGGAAPVPAGPRITLRVVGISRTPTDLSLQGSVGGVLLLPRAFVVAHGEQIGDFSGPTGGVLFVRLTDGGAGVPGSSTSSVASWTNGPSLSTLQP